ncbi:MAG: 1-acyl-sn-glycerol-3-phosphate acyltransferase [Cytophagaceae bacterium]|nr:1-acyl-sn-glycerol-3-phosphate acyltransferase [Cytophagaceae bacterium]
MLSWIARTLFHLSGWRVVGDAPRQLQKAIWIVAPHATSWDLIVGLGARSVLGIPIGFLGKKELFTPWLGWFFRAMGGHPVDRGRQQNLVEAEADFIRHHSQIHIAIAPEGTRGDVSELKTGFYRIARLAGVPIVMVGFDYPRKRIILREPYWPSGNWIADRSEVAAFYNTIPGVKKKWVQAYLLPQTSPNQ